MISLFTCKNKDTYPPFKNGDYLEEYFLKNYQLGTVRKYIPALWTNFQIEGWFQSRKNEMQQSLDNWVITNPSNTGYFTVVQYDDGPLLRLPPDTIIYGSCSGNIPIPLIYEDINFTLEKNISKSFNDSEILCSFVGALTHPVRSQIVNLFKNNNLFKIIANNNWTAVVNKNSQSLFIDTTINSKFALAPRGYGRSSFRFFEIFKLKKIPVYVWDDFEWLPFKETIDYSKLCISLNIKEIHNLPNILQNITENDYYKMLEYYSNIKHYFDLPGMTELICSNV